MWGGGTNHGCRGRPTPQPASAEPTAGKRVFHLLSFIIIILSFRAEGAASPQPASAEPTATAGRRISIINFIIILYVQSLTLASLGRASGRKAGIYH